MKKRWLLGAAAALALALAGCSDEESAKQVDAGQETVEKDNANDGAKSETISYLGTDYTVKTPADRIVTASLESMEDAAMLDIKPTGVLEVAGKIPSYLAEDLAGAELIGDKRAPNAEAILALDPDVIVGTSKWGEDVMADINKIQTTIPYSHISTNWKDNLTTLAEIAGKEDQAEKIIADYEKDAEAAKVEVADKMADETVLIIRVRGGLMYVYPTDVYLNPVLYEDLGLAVPEVVANSKAQAEITLETLASINPDALFLQFEESENAEAPAALEDLQKDPIFKSLKASQSDRVFINAVDPLAQGGTAWSKVKFLNSAVENLLQ